MTLFAPIWYIHFFIYIFFLNQIFFANQTITIVSNFSYIFKCWWWIIVRGSWWLDTLFVVLVMRCVVVWNPCTTVQQLLLRASATRDVAAAYTYFMRVWTGAHHCSTLSNTQKLTITSVFDNPELCICALSSRLYLVFWRRALMRIMLCVSSHLMGDNGAATATTRSVIAIHILWIAFS